MQRALSSFSPTQQKIVKTGAAAAVVYSAIRAAEVIRERNRSPLPTFADFDRIRVSKREAALLGLDYALLHAMHRLASLAENDRTDDVVIGFAEATRAVSIFLERCLVDNDARAANEKIKRAEEKLRTFLSLLDTTRSIVAHFVAKDDVEVIVSCMLSHLKNSMIDKHF